MLDIEPLTKEEKKWLKDFQKLMDKCPSSRFGAYTVGDSDLTIYDKIAFDDYREDDLHYMKDDVNIHDEAGTVFLSISMPFQVDGVSG